MKSQGVWVVALLIGGTVACGASASRVTGPDGSFNWYAITCRRNRSNCYEKAGEVCPGGYKVADGDDREGIYAHADSSSTMVTTTYHGEMLIKCKGAPAE